MPTYRDVIVRTINIEVGEKFDALTTGGPLYDVELVDINQDPITGDVSVQLNSTANGVEAVDLRELGILLPMSPGQPVDVPSIMSVPAAPKTLSYVIGSANANQH